MAHLNLRLPLYAAVAAAYLSIACAPAHASECLQRALAGADTSRSTAHAFDFYTGNWNVRMRQRKVDANLRAASAWVTFDATVTVHRLFQGAGFFEEYRLNKPGGTKFAVGSRLYNPQSNQWKIYWANKNDGQWEEPPATGGVLTQDGIDFIYDDTWGSRPVLTRYRWTTQDPNHPVWQQAFSGNCGATWTANWTMEFSRK